MAARIIHFPHIVPQDDLRARIVGIALIAEEFSDVLDVLVAAVEFILGSGVIDTDQEGLLTH